MGNRAFFQVLLSSPIDMSVVKAEQERDRIAGALVSLIGEHGYSQTTLEELLERAEVDRETFEQSFQSLDDCFAEVWRGFAQSLAARVLEAYGGAGSWRDGVRAQAWELCRMIEEDPVRARICLVEVNFGGDLVQATRDIVMGAYVELIHLGRHELERGAAVPRAQAEAVVGAIWERVGRNVNAGSLDALVEDVPGLLYLVYLPYLGPAAAEEELRRGREDLARYRAGAL